VETLQTSEKVKIKEDFAQICALTRTQVRTKLLGQKTIYEDNIEEKR
jgi:hypothetical protein